jgi:hypothetical protein
LRRRLFISGRAIDLARAIEARNRADLQIAGQSARIDVVIFHGITRHDHLNALQPLHAPQHGQLNVFGQRCADPVRIDQMGAQTFRLEKHLMAFAITEAVDLVFDRRAIARPLPSDRSAEQGRAI